MVKDPVRRCLFDNLSPHWDVQDLYKLSRMAKLVKLDFVTISSRGMFVNATKKGTGYFFYSLIKIGSGSILPCY